MKNFKLGIIVDSFRKDFKTNVEIAHSLGADGIQMYMVEGELAPDCMTPEKIEEVKAILRDNEMEISAVCADLGGHGFAKAEDNDAKVATSKRIVDIANELGAKVLTTHIGVIPEDKTCERYKVMQDACRTLGLYAEERGMRFAIETGPEKSHRAQRIPRQPQLQGHGRQPRSRQLRHGYRPRSRRSGVSA